VEELNGLRVVYHTGNSPVERLRTEGRPNTCAKGELHFELAFRFGVVSVEIVDGQRCSVFRQTEALGQCLWW